MPPARSAATPAEAARLSAAATIPTGAQVVAPTETLARVVSEGMSRFYSERRVTADSAQVLFAEGLVCPADH